MAFALELAVGQEIGTQQKQCKSAFWGGSCTQFAVPPELCSLFIILGILSLDLERISVLNSA